MRLTLRHDLPFVSVNVKHGGASVKVEDVLVDTGSGGTILSVDALAAVGIAAERDNRLYTIRGVGGTELVFRRRIDHLSVAGRALDDVEIQIGGVDYGFAINGILGMDVLRRAGAVLDLHDLTIEFAER